MPRKVIHAYKYLCDKCNSPVHRYRITKLSPKKLKRKYIFTEYEKCEKCDYIKLDNDYKIILNN